MDDGRYQEENYQGSKTKLPRPNSQIRPHACQSLFTTHELETLKAVSIDGVRRHLTSREDQLSGEFEKISPTQHPSSDGDLVHNLSPDRLPQQQLAVLSFDAKFNTRDTRPEDLIASFELALQKCDVGEE
ncbi:unnamed protein product [Schistocephalus solidus]|uniref:Uncharacterized protein n=1 Tax=Schistocephalus solidus TaxID=70667 RepID=A0A183SBB0_SCHSO|nr:unnamed protein product [Schistocephalus solidus]